MSASTFRQLGSILDGPHATPTRQDEGPYFLNISSLVSGRLDLSLSDHVSAEDFTKWTRRVTPQPGDLLFSYETRLGEAALMPAGIEACLGRRMALLRPNRDVVDPRFLLYYYLSPGFQEVIAQRSIHGATVERILLSNMGEWPVSIPPLATQRAIADILGALDDKIAVNAHLSSTADTLVRGMFDRFLGCDESIHLGDLASNPRIAASPPFDADHYVGLEHVPRRLMWLTESGAAEGLASGKFQFLRDDVLFGKLRPYFHKVVVADRAGVCSTDILVLRPKDQATRGFVWAATASDSVVARVSAMSEGTRMPRTNWATLASSEVPWPGEAVAKEFSNRVVALRDRVAAGIAESTSLANLRDTLLPHLMSGRITVRDAEKAVEGVL